MASSTPPVVLFGYDSSPFTQKIRLVLRLKQVPYTFITVPSMLPRPVLRDSFHLTYRKIPVLAIGREIYVDTSLITEAIEHTFPASAGFRSIFPATADGRNYRPIMRGFASYWIDRPFFRVTTGLIPASVWRTSFGPDRAGLIGHQLDPNKLEAKLPQNYSQLDLQLSLLEPLFQTTDSSPWIFSTETPSLADLTLYYQLSWGLDIAAGRGIKNLTGGETDDTDTEGASIVFNQARYPALYRWFKILGDYLSKLPSTETRPASPNEALERMKAYGMPRATSNLLPTPNASHAALDERNGLRLGVQVSVVPDDTGRDNPTIGTLVEISPEEIIVKPRELDGPAPIDVHVHFPKLGFVVQPVRVAKL